MKKEFRLSNELDKKAPQLKIFTKLFSDISDRYDAQFYWENMNFDSCIKLSKIARVSGGKRLPKGFDYSDSATNFRYLRVGDVNWDSTLNYKDFKYISEELFYILKRYMISNGELMIAIVGATIGKCSLLNNPLDEDVVLTENCAKISLKTDKVIPEYLLLLLQSDFVQRQIQLNYIQTTLPKLGLDRVLSLQIPEPPSVELQQYYLSIYQKAFHIKKKKEAEAQRLLDSIDDYLLGELGIKLPPSTPLRGRVESTLQSRMFTRRLSEVSGGRFDPKQYDMKTVFLKSSIKKSIYPTAKLKELIIDSISGAWGNDLNSNSDGCSICLIIRSTEFDNLFNLKLDNSRLKYRLINDAKLIKIRVNENDLLVEKSGGSPNQPVGRIALITKDILGKSENISFSNFVQKIRANENIVLPRYLFCFLKTAHNKGLTDSMQSQTNGIRNLILSNYYNQEIPLPPIEKQNEIADHITKIRDKAKRLRQEAKDGLEHAKKEVEAMILGKDESKDKL